MSRKDVARHVAVSEATAGSGLNNMPRISVGYQHYVALYGTDHRWRSAPQVCIVAQQFATERGTP